MLIAMIICLLCGTITAMEVVGVIGSRNENVIFLYRLVIWPLIWYFLLVPLFRYILVTWAGEPTQIFPLLAFFLSISSVSSRVFMFNIENKVYFLILTFADAILQSAFNLHHRDNPIIDRFMLRTCWRRCVALPQQDATRVSGTFDPTGSLVFVDPARQRFVRMLWFQAQSIVELCTIFGASLRVWAFYDARYIFALYYQEQCETFRDGFQWADWGLKLGISVGTVLVSDMGSSYFAYIQGFPLRQSFHALTRNVTSWVSFSFMNWGGMMLLVMILCPVVGRVGNCADFDNGCTCENIKLYRELCGCCRGVGEAAANYSQRLARSAYGLCRG